jgi:hypothetical protein
MVARVNNARGSMSKKLFLDAFLEGGQLLGVSQWRLKLKKKPKSHGVPDVFLDRH